MEIRNLTYKNNLKEINYNFDYKKIYGIIGNKENATILLEIIRGLKKQTSGSLEKNNLKVYMLFQDSENQLFCKTVKDDILYGLNQSEVDLSQIMDKINLDQSVLDKNYLDLSAGERRKIVIASMLAFDPDVILLDNFLNLLDFRSQKEFVKLLKELQFNEHKTVIVSDQNINLLYEIVDEVVVLENEIILSGNKYDVFANDELLVDLNIGIPDYIKFSNLAKTRKNIDLPYRDRITDIVKDVYDNV